MSLSSLNIYYFNLLKEEPCSLQPCSVKLKISKKSWSEKNIFENGKVF
jgi:hypothetical protein